IVNDILRTFKEYDKKRIESLSLALARLYFLHSFTIPLVGNKEDFEREFEKITLLAKNKNKSIPKVIKELENSKKLPPYLADFFEFKEKIKGLFEI
ncbi:MAG: hypothetical protein ABIH76_02270, partial [Candidatus Bathyarchaeota archaeon]